MKQFNTGTGLAVLGVCGLAATVVAMHRGGGEAFAQGTGGARQIVSTSVYALSSGYNSSQIYASHYAYRIWSDNTIDIRCLGHSVGSASNQDHIFIVPSQGNALGWKTVDNGTSGFRPLTDVDMSGETDAGDISQVLLDFNTRSDDLPPPPIDCTINAPR